VALVHALAACCLSKVVHLATLAAVLDEGADYADTSPMPLRQTTHHADVVALRGVRELDDHFRLL